MNEETKDLLKNFISDNLKTIKRTYFIKGFQCTDRGIYKKATNTNVKKMIDKLTGFNSARLPKGFNALNYTLKRLNPFNIYSVNIDDLFSFTFEVSSDGRFNNVVVIFLPKKGA